MKGRKSSQLHPLVLLILLLTWFAAEAESAWRPPGLTTQQTTRPGASKSPAKRKPTAKRKTTVRRKTTTRRRAGVVRSGVRRKTVRRTSARYATPKTYPPPDSAFRVRYPELPADFQPAFMRPEQNRIETFGAGADALRSFRAAVGQRSAGAERQVRVLHLGDSHLQADMITSRVREAWQEPARGGLGSAGRGLVFPYSLAHTHNPWDYRVTFTGAWIGHRSAIPSHHASWGVAGLTATTTTAGATFTLRLVGASAARSPTTRVRVFYRLADSTSYQLELLDSANVASYAPDYGSGCAVWTLRQPVTAVAFRVRQTRPQQSRLVLQGLSLENDDPGLRYDVSGGNGATVDSYLRCGRLRRQVAALAPDLVIISLGTNDVFGGTFDSVAFRRSYGTLLQLLQRAAPGASVLLTTPGDTFRNGHPNAARTATAARVIRGLAEETGAGVWDFFALMGGGGSIRDWTATGLAQRDFVHYTPRGYYLQGDLLSLALRAALREDGGPVAPPLLPADPK